VTKKLSCWVGRHTWTTRVEKGEAHRVCSKCGGTPRRGTTEPETHGSQQVSEHYVPPA